MGLEVPLLGNGQVADMGLPPVNPEVICSIFRDMRINTYPLKPLL